MSNRTHVKIELSPVAEFVLIKLASVIEPSHSGIETDNLTRMYEAESVGLPPHFDFYQVKELVNEALDALCFFGFAEKHAYNWHKITWDGNRVYKTFLRKETGNE